MLPNMAQRYGILPREVPSVNNVSQYVDTGINRMRKFTPPIQCPQRNVYVDNQIPSTSGINRAQMAFRQALANMNASTSNSGFKKPKELARPVSSAPPLRALETSSDGRYSPTRSVLNVPSRNASFSGGNANNSTDNKRRPDNIAQGVSEMPVQVSDVLPSVPRLGALSENVPAKKNVRENNSDAENSNSTSGNLNFRVFGSSESERMFIFTGTVERIIKWNKIFQNHFCYFEVIASVISIQEGTIKSQKIMLLRDRKGPILQMIYYGTTHLNIEDFHVGQILRCMGKMSAPNVLNAISIRSASQEEVDILQRLCLVCDQAISHFLNA